MNLVLPMTAYIRSRFLRLFAPVVFIVLLLVLLAAVSFNILSSLRAFVTAESLWSKAQKEAVASLHHYVDEADEASFRNFLVKVSVPQGDWAARLEMDRDSPDMAVVTAGFLAAGCHLEDIPGMAWLYRHFRHAPYIDSAVLNWIDGDELIRQLTVLGTQYHEARLKSDSSAAERGAIKRELDRLDAAFSPLETGFSSSLGSASRLTLRALSLAILLVAIGLLMVMGVVFRRLMRKSDKSERDLALSEERLRLGFEGTNCGLWDWNIVTNEVFYSPWIYRLLEYDHVIAGSDKNFLEMVHPDDHESTMAAGRAHILYDIPYDIEYRIRTHTGKYLWVRSRAQAIRDEQGKAIRMAGSIFDISKLKVAEHGAFIDRELAQVTLAAIADAVIRVGMDGCINYCNAMAEQLLGQSFETIRNQSLMSACAASADLQETHRVDLVGSVLAGETAVYENANLYLARSDGRMIAVDASVAPMQDQGGHVFGAVVILHDVSSQREHAAQLAHQASRDELTGLLNRREFERQLGDLLAIDFAARGRHAIMYLDLDQLKIVNDRGGHAAGDQLIRQLGALLQQRVRKGDVLARLGGDEFGVILKDCGAENAARIAETMREMIFETRFIWEGRSFSTGISIGLITELEHFTSVSDLMKVADAACFIAKEKGRNRVHLYCADDYELSLRHREIEWFARIEDAFDQHRFCLHAQRIVPAASDDERKQHVEILLRMLDAEGNLIAPMSFIPAAERYNLMPKIDRWVIGTAFSILAGAFSLGVDRGGVTCAINISGASLEDELFFDFIVEQQRRTAVPFSAICFEITETAAISNLPKAAEFIIRLRSVGCSFSLDDFGAGMASFGYLKHLPVDFLKIDGSFVKDMMNNPIDFAMVESINHIGHVMHKKTIAEFVENDSIFCALQKMGVDYAQGFGIGKPEPFHAQYLLDNLGRGDKLANSQMLGFGEEEEDDRQVV